MIPARSDGPTDLDALDDALTDDMDVVSVMAANGETGVINPVREAARLAHGHGALFRCDATQAIGRIPFDARETGIDVVALSNHKIYGPKGADALVATGEGSAQRDPQCASDSGLWHGLRDRNQGDVCGSGQRPHATYE